MNLVKKMNDYGLKLTSKRGLTLIAAALVLSVLMVAGSVVTVQSAGKPSVKVTVISDGQSWEYSSDCSSVGGILKQAGVSLGSMDKVTPALTATATQGMRIRVARVTTQTITQTEKIAYSTHAKFDPRGCAERTVIQSGKPGEKVVKYLMTYKDGVKVGAEVIGTQVTVKPVTEIIAVSNSTRFEMASREGHRFPYIYMEATGYAPFVCGGSASGRAANGMHAGRGVVAIDPRVIQMGTQLYVEGYGYCIAGDTGGAIKGARIDLGFDSRSEAMDFGRRPVKVYILGR